LRRNRRFWQTILLVGDTSCVLLAMYLALVARHIQFRTPRALVDSFVDPFWDFTGAACITIAILIPAFYVADLYGFRVRSNRLKHAVRLVVAVAVATLLITTAFYWIPRYKLFRLAQAYNTVAMTLLLLIWRMLVFGYIYRHLPRRRVLVVGGGRAGRLIIRTIRDNPDLLYELVGVVDDDPALRGGSVGGVPVVADSAGMQAVARERNVAVIVLAIGAEVSERTLRYLFECKVAGFQVTDMTRQYKECTCKVPIEHVDDRWFIYGPDFLVMCRPWRRRLFRVLDVSLATVGLVLASPLMLMAAAAVKLDSPGSVLFRQRRVGLGERPYTILKFRTMTMDAEAGRGAVWARTDDPRVTRIGRFLRRSRIDELPQLWNVLLGEMAVVGPRPERPEFVTQLKEKIPYYALRFAVKPGLTGWAQVHYRYGASEADALEKLQYELFYMQEENLVRFLVVLARTAQTVVSRAGS
jgi:exopolysaccharide biosynthesis polyprenyl glycosylphosphotransferase